MKMLFAAALLVAGPAVAQTAQPNSPGNTGPTLAQLPTKAPALPGATAKPKPVVAPPQVSRNAPMVRCDSPQWKLLGISLAGFNAIFSLVGAFTIFALMRKTR